MGSPTFLPPLCERCLKPASDEIHGPVETCRENGRGWCNEPWVHHAFRPERDFGPLPPTPPAPADHASAAVMRAALRLLKAPYGTPEWSAAGNALSRLAAPNGIRAAEAALPPAPADDAVEEAAEALCDYLDKTSGGEEWKGSSLVRRLRAALRRAKGGDK